MGKFCRIKSQAFFHCSIVQYTYKQPAADFHLILLSFENRVIRLCAKYDHEEGKEKMKEKKKSRIVVVEMK